MKQERECDAVLNIIAKQEKTLDFSQSMVPAYHAIGGWSFYFPFLFVFEGPFSVSLGKALLESSRVMFRHFVRREKRKGHHPLVAMSWTPQVCVLGARENRASRIPDVPSLSREGSTQRGSARYLAKSKYTCNKGRQTEEGVHEMVVNPFDRSAFLCFPKCNASACLKRWRSCFLCRLLSLFSFRLFAFRTPSPPSSLVLCSMRGTNASPV